jgi:prepilin-type N-terminal cleavage/methylation domain-containing protein
MKKSLFISRKGFTLIELMVAMSIALVIMGMLVAITNSAMGFWQRGRAETRASRQAKAMIDLVAKDFESMVVRSGNNYQWLFAKSIPDGDLPGDGGTKNSTNATQLAFFTSASDRYDGNTSPQSTNNSGGDISAVSYKLDYLNPLEGVKSGGGANVNTFVFYRQLTNPDVTFGTGANSGYLAQTDLSTTNLISTNSTDYEKANNAGSSSFPKYKFVCENIYQYSITFILDNPSSNSSGSGGTAVTYEPLRVTLANKTGEGSVDQFNIYGNGVGKDVSGGVVTPISSKVSINAKPKAVEISVTVLSDFGIDQMKQRSFTPSQFEAFLAKNSFQYSKVIELPTR